MVKNFGPTNPFVDAEMAYRRERMRQDFAAINQAAHRRADRQARAAELAAAGQPAAAPRGARRFTWFARFHRSTRPTTR